MPSLSRDQRRALESTVIEARKTAETGARKALDQLAVTHHEAWGTMSSPERALRARLRARGKQLGDARDERRGTQAIDKLALECAYEHWHRMLFARFLAECGVLVEPTSGVPISIDECQELAREQGTDWLGLACSFAQRMLPQIFRNDDPVLEVMLPVEYRHALEELLAALPTGVFLADDSLGWVYQFWQSEQKDIVNQSESKIGAKELPAVTQLFTEDYMVLFLLHNTLGAWWAGKVLATQPELAQRATSEEELRNACSLPGIDWGYLRFLRDEDGLWYPAAGTFDGWPKTAKGITVLDPCMGSGHFLVFALPLLMAIRSYEEGLTNSAAVDAVLGENLFGLEIDPRCTQIAAFNLALSGWRITGYRALPSLHLACSGLSVAAKESDWLALAGEEAGLRVGMEQLYRLFIQAPTLGSLLDPKALGADLFQAGFRELQPLFEKAISRETADENTHEFAVVASGLAQAAEILAGHFTLVATNVPYLGRGKQDRVLKDYCERQHPRAKADLATCFVERCLRFSADACSVALVTPQNWLFLGTYKHLRKRLLEETEWNAVARLGEHSFESSQAAGAFTALLVQTCQEAKDEHSFVGSDASAPSNPEGKATVLRDGPLRLVRQAAQLANPDSRITLEDPRPTTPLLSEVAECYQGARTGDRDRFVASFWEISADGKTWEPYRNTSTSINPSHGLSEAIRWEQGTGSLHEYARETRDKLHDMHESGQRAWGRRGVAINQMRSLRAFLYFGEKFDGNVNVIFTLDDTLLPALWAFCSSPDYEREVRRIDQKVAVTNATLTKVPFDVAEWMRIAGEKFPQGLPKPESDDPTQWLFDGYPLRSASPLHVGVARLLGYRWPRQTGIGFPDCPPVGLDCVESHADLDGIVCLSSMKGEAPATDRLARLLADAFGAEWSASRLATLLSEVGHAGRSLDDWLRDGFFEQHCELFDQRPFVWHVWDGRRDGFHALVNYHRLTAAAGEGRRTMERLIYTYLGDWLERQRADQRNAVEGADARLASAEQLKRELEKILAGEPPYDLFVRWKPLKEQPVGWDPDINDGVRLNIRPFMTAKPLNRSANNACILRVSPRISWDKDRGKEPIRSADDYPWFWGWDGKAENFTGGKAFDGNRWNDLHYSREAKLGARRKGGRA